MTRLARILLALAFAACGDSATTVDAGPHADTGSDIEDSGADAADDIADVAQPNVEPDTPEPDVVSDAPVDVDVDVAQDADAGSDADPGDVGTGPLGEIEGSCGVIGEELDSASSSLFTATIDFGDDPFDDPSDVARLTPGGEAILEAGTAGGSSIYSEVFAYEVLARCDGAALLETEGTIEYRPEHTGSITDFLVEIDGQQVGVSVTRAVGFPRDDPYTVETAGALLSDKLGDVLESSAGVGDEDAWVKQVLVIIAYAEPHVTSLETAVAHVPVEVSADTIIYIVESRGDDAWLY